MTAVNILSIFSNEKLLDLLDEERRKFDRADTVRIKALVDFLIERHVYPKETVPGNPSTVHQMVNGHGARWHAWCPPLKCQHCAADLRDRANGPPYKREVGHVENDRIKYFTCPDCKGRL